MPTLTYIESNGATHHVEARIDRTVMQIAVEHSVPGILADCGGSCSCGTCHAYVDAQWRALLPPLSESEAFMLEAVPEPREGSRLCCQIPMRAELDGMVLRLPAEQL
jgi:2Fe-2S ferredoxin